MKNIAHILSAVAVCFALFVTTPAHTQPQGEIINVNYDYYIAYADLGRDTLQPGDDVEIILSSGDRIYLVVEDASLVVSQLVLPSNADQQARNIFKKISISDKVRVASKTKALRSEDPLNNTARVPAESLSNRDHPSASTSSENASHPAQPSAIPTKSQALHEQEALVKELRLQHEHYVKQIVHLEEQRKQDAAAIEAYKKEVDRLNALMRTLADRLERMAQLSSQGMGQR